MRVVYLWAAICVGVGLWFWPERIGHSEVHVLSADLSFLFDCAGDTDNAIEDTAERFFRNQGFRVLNKAQVQREHGYFAAG